MCMCMCSSLYGSLRNGSSFLFRVRSICKPANGALVLLLADNPDDVVGTVTANMRRLNCGPYPGDRPEKPMAFRRDGLPEGPAPLSLQKDLAVRAAYNQIKGALPPTLALTLALTLTLTLTLSPNPNPNPNPNPDPDPDPDPIPSPTPNVWHPAPTLTLSPPSPSA